MDALDNLTASEIVGRLEREGIIDKLKRQELASRDLTSKEMMEKAKKADASGNLWYVLWGRYGCNLAGDF